jgi:hypothetical protein
MSLHRKTRSLTQRLYLIEALPGQDLIREYMIMGSTGNIYKVTITNQCLCTCPDYQTRFQMCKHIFFVLLRIMNVDQSFDQHGYVFSNSELQSMFDQIPELTRTLCVTSDYHNRYLQAKDQVDQFGQVPQRDIQGDACPICLDDFDELKDLDYCKYSCGKSVHKHCLRMWLRNSQKCMFCRENWEPHPQSNHYLNLGILPQQPSLPRSCLLD